jgi:hypothetical protein
MKRTDSIQIKINDVHSRLFLFTSSGRRIILRLAVCLLLASLVDLIQPLAGDFPLVRGRAVVFGHITRTPG